MLKTKYRSVAMASWGIAVILACSHTIENREPDVPFHAWAAGARLRDSRAAKALDGSDKIGVFVSTHGAERGKANSQIASHVMRSLSEAGIMADLLTDSNDPRLADVMILVSVQCETSLTKGAPDPWTQSHRSYQRSAAIMGNLNNPGAGGLAVANMQTLWDMQDTKLSLSYSIEVHDVVTGKYYQFSELNQLGDEVKKAIRMQGDIFWLTMYLKDTQSDVRANVALQLGKIGDFRVVKELIIALGQETDDRAADCITIALEKVTGMSFGKSAKDWLSWYDKEESRVKDLPTVSRPIFKLELK